MGHARSVAGPRAAAAEGVEDAPSRRSAVAVVVVAAAAAVRVIVATGHGRPPRRRE
jgi:hypothetical protein